MRGRRRELAPPPAPHSFGSLPLPMSIEVREASPEEYAEAGRVTAEAYREFVRPGDDDWERYLLRIADVQARAGDTTIMVAIEDGRVLGSLTLELDGRVRDGDHEHRPLDPGEAHIRMLGVDPAARARGVARALMAASEETARAVGKTFLTLHTTHADGGRPGDVRPPGLPPLGGPRVPGRLRAPQLPQGALGFREPCSGE